MRYFYQQSWWKYFLLFIALLIGIFSLLYTNKLVNELSEEEKRKVEVWAHAYRLLDRVEDDSESFDFIWQVIQGNETIPVILVDEEGKIEASRNLDEERSGDQDYLESQLEIMRSQHESIQLEHENIRRYIYYKESNLIRQLRIFPYVQLIVISFFLVIAYFAFNAARKYEQNRVWVGMAKETAHQLGTPLSSLMAWVDYMDTSEEKKINPSIVHELRKDVERLQLVTERFSKIGSSPVLTKVDIYQLISDNIEYLKNRLSEKVNLRVEKEMEGNAYAFVSPPLFGWVIENLTKNAIDAMGASGDLTFRISENKHCIYIDVTDTGKGIAGSNYEKIFQPGYTTRSRGWGLGLSLARRIITFYHKGRLFVHHSEPGKGTTIRIKLPA